MGLISRNVWVLVLVAGVAACGDDVTDGGGTPGGDAGTEDVGTDDTTGSDTGGPDADAGAGDIGSDGSVDGGDTWEQAGPDPGPMLEQGPAPRQYADVPPATATGEACTTQEWWNGGNHESYDMNPGEDCVACHQAEREGPIFSFAGTVFGGWDDEDDCRGVEDVLIDIIDANGDVVVSMTSRASGNFTSTASMRDIELPYTARLRYDGRERYMVTPQYNGSCNSCHAQEPIGGAPGRVILP